MGGTDQTRGGKTRMPKIVYDTKNDVRALAGERVRPEDERFMRLAIEQARLGDQKPGAGEVGCVIVRDGEVLGAAYNEAELRCDPTAHAEIVALRKLGEKLREVAFNGCTIYCTLQPCTMCTAACIWAKIGRIVYGATRNDVHSMYFDARHFNTRAPGSRGSDAEWACEINVVPGCGTVPFVGNPMF